MARDKETGVYSTSSSSESNMDRINGCSKFKSHTLPVYSSSQSGSVSRASVWCLQESIQSLHPHCLVNEDWKSGEPRSPFWQRQERGKCAEAETAQCSPADIPLVTASIIHLRRHFESFHISPPAPKPTTTTVPFAKINFNEWLSKHGSLS